jgi:two-component system sensor histidine kinase SenX3
VGEYICVHLVNIFDNCLELAAKREAMVKSQKIKKVASDAVAFLEVLDTAGVIVDSENQVIDQSPKAIEMGLVEYEKVISADLIDIIDKARATKESVTEELFFSKNIRSPKLFVSARATMLSEELVILLVEDRTEANRLDETRRDFVENISHELKTPISAISLLAEALQVAIDDTEQVKKFSKNLQRESKRLGSLVNKIIQLSRIQAGDLEGEIEVIDLSQVVNEAVELNQFQADSKNVKISVDAPEGILVRGDAGLLLMALKNLIENAVIYSDDNKQVGVGLTEADDFAEVIVTDKGIGIPVDQQERIFERFYRVDPSRSRDTGGTGLGLSIVKHAANNHGGEVTVFSRPSLGSTFTLRIPIYHDTDQDKEQ